MSEKPLSRRVVVALTLALAAVLAVALVVVANHRSAGLGQGWDDPCATLPADHPVPVTWAFRLADGRVYSSGECGP